MKKSALLAVALIALAGCVSHDFSEGERTNFRCAGDKKFSYREVAGALEVFAGGETTRLTPTGDGQYANERVTLAQSGGGATLTGAIGGPYENCRRQRSDWWFDFW
jgi:hypothetical protein